MELLRDYNRQRSEAASVVMFSFAPMVPQVYLMLRVPPVSDCQFPGPEWERFVLSTGRE